MAKPWEQYQQTASAKPWERYAQPQPEAVARPNDLDQDLTNLLAGGIRGAGSIGATAMRVLPNWIGGDTAEENAQRRASIDYGLQELLGAQPDAGMYQVGKIGAEIAGTAGAGGALGKGLMAAGSRYLPQFAPRLAAAIESGGLSLGGAKAAGAFTRQGLTNAATRIGGGAVAGGAMAGMVNPEEAGTGAAIGAAFPVVAKGAGMAGKLLRGTPQTPEMMRVVKEARDLGYVIPPTQAKPTLANRLIEGFSGKLTTAQNASARNADVTNALAAKAIGLAPDTKLTPEVLKDLRKAAGRAYNVIGKTGTITPSANYTHELDKIAAPFIKASQGFPNAKPSPVIELVESMKSPSFDAAAAVEKIGQLRTAADDAFRSGNTDIARASKAIAGILEDTIESHLQSSGSHSLLQNFRDARKLIAKTYTVEKALNPTTGSVDAKKLGALIKRGKPLTDELKQVGDFANRFPKAAQTPEGMGSLPQSSPLDWSAAGIASFMAGNPLPMAGVVARPATRKLALSNLVQNRLIDKPITTNRLADLMKNPATRAALISAQSK